MLFNSWNWYLIMNDRNIFKLKIACWLGLYLIYQIFQLSLKVSLSKGMIMVSTMPGPQYKHSAASMLSISFFLLLNSLYSFYMLKLPISSSRLFDHMFNALIIENPPWAYFTCVFYCFLRIIRYYKALISWERASTSLSFLAFNDGWALVADWRHTLWKPCMHGKM